MRSKADKTFVIVETLICPLRFSLFVRNIAADLKHPFCTPPHYDSSSLHNFLKNVNHFAN